jgi:hypothetical protein
MSKVLIAASVIAICSTFLKDMVTRRDREPVAADEMVLAQ